MSEPQLFLREMDLLVDVNLTLGTWFQIVNVQMYSKSQAQLNVLFMIK